MRKKLTELPLPMAERAKRARELACGDPRLVEADDDFLPWVYDSLDEVWYSFDGNYSHSSPQEKREKAADRARKEVEWQIKSEEQAREKLIHTMTWSLLREEVLDRDNHQCILCKKYATTPLHIHHVLKVRNGGTDTLDNLVTVCSRCHPKADRSMYDPEWETTQRLEKIRPKLSSIKKEKIDASQE